jgi:sec-independent protein translocase protein TatC
MDEPNGGNPPSDQHTAFPYPDDPYDGHRPDTAPSVETAVVPAGAGGGTPPPPPPPEDEDEDDDGMLRMSFLEHLEELRHRIIRALMGFGVAFLLCIVFANQLWRIVQAPAADALKKIGVADGKLAIIDPMEGFSIIWVWTPLVATMFVASPWVIYQIWAFIAPGLYKRERKWAIPFVLTTAGLFLLGGMFAYFIAFRYGLAFLLGIGVTSGVVPIVSIDRYFSLFVNVMLGVALVFEMPVVIFFLCLLRLASPKWLLDNSRYAILAIVIIAAIVTPTPDVFNLMLFAVPMCALFFVGIFAGYLLVLKREGRRFPWGKVLKWVGIAGLLIAAALYLAVTRYGYHLVRHWPFLAK